MTNIFKIKNTTFFTICLLLCSVISFSHDFELIISKKIKDNIFNIGKNEPNNVKSKSISLITKYDYENQKKSNQISSKKSYILTTDHLNAYASVNNFPDIACTAGAASETPSLCINTALTPITHATTGATGIGTPTGLPAGVNAVWVSNTITISGTPNAVGIFNYSIPLTSGCETINAVGTITVTAANSIALTSATGTDNQSININIPITNINYSISGSTSVNVNGLPNGVTSNITSNLVTISGSPTVSGMFNYSITITGSCGIKTVTGKITTLCEPITGIIKIIKTSSIRHEFSVGKISTALACEENTFPLKYYTATANLDVNTKLFSNENLTIPVNTTNLWYQNKLTGISYRIDNTGKITEISNCGETPVSTQTYWYYAIHPAGFSGTDFVIYIDEAGVEQQITLPRASNGNDPVCKKIIAQRIVSHTGAAPCNE